MYTVQTCSCYGMLVFLNWAELIQKITEVRIALDSFYQPWDDPHIIWPSWQETARTINLVVYGITGHARQTFPLPHDPLSQSTFIPFPVPPLPSLIHRPHPPPHHLPFEIHWFHFTRCTSSIHKRTIHNVHTFKKLLMQNIQIARKRCRKAEMYTVTQMKKIWHLTKFSHNP